MNYLHTQKKGIQYKYIESGKKLDKNSLLSSGILLFSTMKRMKRNRKELYRFEDNSPYNFTENNSVLLRIWQRVTVRSIGVANKIPLPTNNIRNLNNIK